jgi:hypothetical protein
LDKIKITYFSNKLNFHNIPPSEYDDVRGLWVDLREDYTDWVANFGVNGAIDGKRISEDLKWKGIPTWWFSPLSAKDVEQGRYLNQLMVLYLVKKFEKNIEIYLDDKILLDTILINFPHVSVDFNKIRTGAKFNYNNFKLYLSGFGGVASCVILLKSIIRVFTVYLLTYKYKNKQNNKYKNVKASVWFVSTYPANWVQVNGNKKDRHLLHAIDLDKHYNEKARYIIYIYKYARDRKLGFLQLYKELSNLNMVIGRDVVFVESNLSVKDIFEAYYSTLLEWIKFEKWIRNDEFKELFVINKMDMSLVLQDVWRKGFFGGIQYCKLHGLAIGKFLGELNNPQTIVTYGDFFAEFRGDYFFGRKSSPGTKFVSVQHSQMNKNYGPAYNRKIEFDKEMYNDNSLVLPSPDYCLIQGEQYKKILSSFYPEDRISIIGSLRHHSISNDKEVIKDNLVIIAFSTTDVEILISFIKDIKIDSNWSIIITPHPGNDIDLLKRLLRENCQNLNFIFNSTDQTMSLLPKAKLLISSMTNLAFESGIYNTRSIRVSPINMYPTRAGDIRIPEFHNGHEFSAWFEDNKDSLIDVNLSEIVEDYYYKIDGKSAERLWGFLMSNNKLPHNKHGN